MSCTTHRILLDNELNEVRQARREAHIWRRERGSFYSDSRNGRDRLQ